MPSPTLHDTTSADFSAGSSTGTYVAENGDGELTLAPASGSEFSGSTMPSGWATRIWSGGGSAIVSGGKLTVDGARVATCVDVGGACVEQFNLVPGTSLEFVATFTGDPYQHSGLGQTLESSFEPLALFSTSWTDASGVVPVGRLARRADLQRHRRGRRNPDESRARPPERAAPVPHRLAAGAGRLLGGRCRRWRRTRWRLAAPMRPVAASDFNAFSGTIVVDWVRDTPYRERGLVPLARVRCLDRGQLAEHQLGRRRRRPARRSRSAFAPAARAVPDATWSRSRRCRRRARSTLQSRYIQYRAEMATADVLQTPALADVRDQRRGAATGSAAADGTDDHVPPDRRRRRLVIRRSRSQRDARRPACR